MVIGLVNAAMFGRKSEPGENVSWSEPDYFDVEVFEQLVGQSVESYAANNPHMIVFVDSEDSYPHPDNCLCDDCMY